MDKFPDLRQGQSFGLIDRDGYFVLDVAVARLLDRIARAAERLGRWSATRPLKLRDDGDGRSLAIDLPWKIRGKLAGTGSPYDLTEQAPTPGGGWADATGGVSCTACAYEASGIGGLAGKVVPLVNFGPDDWRFRFLRVGCYVCLVVKDACTAAVLPGATVDVKQGTTDLGTYTSASDGTICLETVSGGPFTVTASLTGYATTSTSVTPGCHAASPTAVLLAKSTVVYTFKPTICCGDPPSSTIPVTVSVTQTSGGTFTGTCTSSGSAGCSMTLPVPPAGSAGYNFSVTYSATNMVSVTSTFTVNPAACAKTLTANLQVASGSGRFCLGCSNCIGVAPTTLNVTTTIPGCAGPYSVTLTNPDDTQCEAHYSGDTVCGTGVTISVSVIINSGGGCNTATVTGLAGGGCSCSGFASDPSGLISGGTLGCPVNFTISDGNGHTITVSQ